MWETVTIRAEQNKRLTYSLRVRLLNNENSFLLPEHNNELLILRVKLYINIYSIAEADSVRAQQHTDFLIISPVKTQAWVSRFEFKASQSTANNSSNVQCAYTISNVTTVEKEKICNSVFCMSKLCKQAKSCIFTTL